MSKYGTIRMSQPKQSKSAEASSSSTSIAAKASTEDALRQQLRSSLLSLTKREPLEPSYKKMLLSGTLTRRTPVLTQDKFYKRLWKSRLCDRVTKYQAEMAGKDYFDRISQRQPLEESAMRAAFTLREAKEHEQAPLLEATVAALKKDWPPSRKRHCEAMVQGLIHHHSSDSSAAGGTAEKGKKKGRKTPPLNPREQAELERQRADFRKKEDARQKREEQERKERLKNIIAERKKPNPDGSQTPQQQLHDKLVPYVQKLWDMEFPSLGGTNPFRVVIDRENCAAIGAPDYFQVIDIPMNLTYIKERVESLHYNNFTEFMGDVDLVITNALKYNKASSNPYHIAAKEMKKRNDKMVSKIWQELQGMNLL
jgi:hypothetical protein